MIRARERVLWGSLFVAAAAIATACSGSTSPHQPTPCPSYTGGKAANDTLYGLYHLASYCLDTLPAYGPPTDTGHVTLSHATAVDSFVAVLVSQGQPAETILGTYTHPVPDSIHVTGQVRVAGLAVPVEVVGRFLLRHDTLSVSGQLSGKPLSLTAVRAP